MGQNIVKDKTVITEDIAGLADNDIDLSDVTTIASSTGEELMELEEAGARGEGEADGEAEKYQTVKSHLKTFLQKKPDQQEQKQTRTRLIDNVNSYL